jgi:hypothetical protein
MSARGSLGAVPAHLWLVRRGYKRCWMYVTLGACLGIATLSIFAFPQFLGNPVPPLAPLVFLVGLVVACGVSTALLFWLIVVRRYKPRVQLKQNPNGKNEAPKEA